MPGLSQPPRGLAALQARLAGLRQSVLGKEPTALRRLALLASSLVLISAGLALAWFQPGGGDASTWTAICLRSGMLLGALWLALPEMLVIRRGRLAAVLLAVMALAWRPRLFLVAAGLLVTLAFLRPRTGPIR